ALFVTRQITPHDKALNLLLKGVFFATVLVAIIGLMQAFFALSSVPQATPPASTFSNKNMANHPIILSFALGVYFLFKRGERPLMVDVIYTVSMVILLAFVFHTKTRAAWLGLAVEGLIFSMFTVWMLKRGHLTHLVFDARRKRVVGVGVLCLLALMSFKYDTAIRQLAFHNPLSVLTDVAENTANQLSPSSNKGSFDTRKKIWSGTWDVIKSAPLMGVGMGNFYSAYPEHYLHNTESIRRAHNDYLEMIAEIGIIGFAVFLIGMLFTVRMLMHLITQAERSETRFLAMCIITMFAGTAVNAVFSFPYYHITPMVLMGIYIGVIVGLHAKLSKSGDSVIQITSHKGASIALICVLGAFAFVALRAAFHVEGMERKWTKQLHELKWQHMAFDTPKWLETTHYSPVLHGMYSALIRERNRYDAMAKKEANFNKRMEFRNSRNTFNQLAQDVADNSNQYTPQLNFLMSMAQEARNAGAYKKARTYLDQAASLSGKGNINTYIGITSLIKHTEGEAAAMAYLNNVQATVSPEFLAHNEMSYLSLGAAFFELKDFDKALDLFKQGLSIFPNTLGYLESIIRLLHSSDQRRESIPYMKQYVEQADESAVMLPSVKSELSKLSTSPVE
ncbi:MAG: O-antigen ligase family protein, partial [Pseudomonadota bacterium]